MTDKGGQDTDSGGGASCREYPGVDTGDKEPRGLRAWYSEADLPDEKRPHAMRIVADIAGEYGFGEPQTLVDATGDHEISLKDGYGAEITFGTKVHIHAHPHRMPPHRGGTQTRKTSKRTVTGIRVGHSGHGREDWWRTDAPREKPCRLAASAMCR